METNVINQVSESNFSLKKVKLAKDGGIDVHFECIETMDGQTYSNKYHVESAKDVHPDLLELFKRLSGFIGDSFKFDEKAKKNIEARQVSWSGVEDNVGVVLTGSLEAANGQKTALNTPRIKFSCDSFGFETELEKLCDQIKSETYLFLFKGKKAQLELFGADGEPTEDAACDDTDN